MATKNDFTAKIMDFATEAADKVKDTMDLAKINLAIANEQKEIEKNYRTIGEWYVNEFEGEVPDGVRPLFEAIAASKVKIADLEESKPKGKDADNVDASADGQKACPICGKFSDSKFCPSCGAPMGE